MKSAWPADDVFPRGELYLACGLALALRLGFLVGVAHTPLFLHPVVQAPPQHPYAWFLALLTRLTGGDPLVVRVVQMLLDTASVFLLGATAHEIWGRRAAVFTAEIAALSASLIYYAADLSPGVFSFFLVCASLYWCTRMARVGSRAGVIMAGTALAFAIMILVQGGGDANPPGGVGSYLLNLAWAWSRSRVPCGVMDPGFFGPYLSPMFRLPWLPSFGVIAPVAIVIGWSERRKAPLLVGYLVVVTLVLAATPICGRTRMALLAGAIPLAGRGVDEFLAAFDRAAAEKRTWAWDTLLRAARGHGRTVLALVLAAAFVNLVPARRARPTAGVGWWIVGRAYVEAGQYREAQAAYAQAEQSGLRSSVFYAEWGRLENEKRIGILAEQHLVTAIQLDPRNADGHEALGDVYAAQEHFILAGQEYAIAADLIPGRAAELHTRAGQAYRDGNDNDRAREMFQRALRDVPGYEAAESGLRALEHPVTIQPGATFDLSPSSAR